MAEKPSANQLEQIFHLLYEQTGVDFSDYKVATMNRRIQRRMLLQGIKSLDKYLVFIRRSSDELNLLQNDLLINVTRFFRDSEKFIALTKVVFPVIVRNKSSQEPIRIWVPACATGEEAYSIAILLSEFLKKKPSIKFQIFATDVNSVLIEKARNGLYPESIADHISSDRLQQFFTKVDKGYLVNEELHEKCVFAVHDLTQNPPLSKLDLISCLNVLIYLEPSLQKKILSSFHFSLKPDGFLMLGNSESIGMDRQDFHIVDSKNKIYSKNMSSSDKPIKYAKNPKQEKLSLPIENRVTGNGSIKMQQVPADLVSRLEKIARLKEALDHTREYADSIVDELNVITEELQSANEELLVNNEELQTANEELETSHEELQSANEELLSLNIELQKRGEELARLAAIVESSDDAIISKDLKGIITSWNQGAERLYGYQDQEIVGKSVALLMPPDKKNDFPKILKILLSGKRVEHYETQRLTKDGRVIDVSLTVSPLKDAKGKIIGASKIARNITEKKQLEENIKFLSDSSKALSSSLDYKTTLDAVAKFAVPQIADWCAVDMLDQDGKFELVSVAHRNPEKVKWARELRKAYPPNMNSSNGLGNVVRTGKSELYPDISDELLVATAIDEKQLKLLRGLGFSSAMFVPICINGKCIGVITFVNSESNRHYNQGDLVIALELANRVSLAVEHAKLYEDAQNAISLRDDFISIASHELKTPITSLKIYTQGLQKNFETRDKDAFITYFNKMDQQVDKLTTLITDLLNVSRMQMGKLDLNEESFNLKALVKECVESVQSTTQKHSIIIEGKISNSVWGDKDRIGQVLTNLLTNAIKYSPKESKIIVSLTELKNMAKVSVQDFGIGIEQQHLSKIFNRFYRVSDKTEKTFPGLGIGLFISNNIIKRHGGTMSVISTKGKGSKFSFTLPYERI